MLRIHAKNKVGCVLAPFRYLMHLSFFFSYHDCHVINLFVGTSNISIAFLSFCWSIRQNNNIYCYFVQPWASLVTSTVTNPVGLLIPWRALVFWWAYLKLRDPLFHFSLLWKSSAGSSAHVKEYSCIFLGFFICLAMLMEKRQQNYSRDRDC